MSEEQLSALLAKLKEDVGLQEKLKGAADLDAFSAIAKEEGFDVSKADWLKFQANQTHELSDEELEGMAGGTFLLTLTAIFFTPSNACDPEPGESGLVNFSKLG